MIILLVKTRPTARVKTAWFDKSILLIIVWCRMFLSRRVSPEIVVPEVWLTSGTRASASAGINLNLPKLFLYHWSERTSISLVKEEYSFIPTPVWEVWATTLSYLLQFDPAAVGKHNNGVKVNFKWKNYIKIVRKTLQVLQVQNGRHREQVCVTW